MLRALWIFVFAFSLVSCDKPDPDDVVGTEYAYFSVNQMRTAANLRQDALEGSGAHALLESLTAAAAPRLAGSENDAKAVAWAEAAFREAGLQNVHAEPFTFEGWRRVSAKAEVVIPTLLGLSVTSIGYSVATPDGGVIGAIAHFKTFEDLAAADPKAVAGKIVFISNRMERAQDGSGYGPAVVARTKGHAEAAKKGALALIIRSVGTDDSDSPHTGAMQIAAGEPTVPAAALGNRSADALLALVEKNPTVTLRLDLQNASLGPITSHNVVGEIPGSAKPEEIVIVGAHLDSWDLAEGAMDDGMGVATTLAAVKAIAALPKRPARTIRLIAFGAEEFGLKGANAYAETHQNEIPSHVFGMESDFGLGKAWLLRHAVEEPVVPVVREIWRLVGPMGIGWDPEKFGHIGPDLTPLAEKGMPGALLVGDGTRYFDIHHTENDVLANIKADDLDYNVAAYAGVLYLVADFGGSLSSPESKE